MKDINPQSLIQKFPHVWAAASKSAQEQMTPFDADRIAARVKSLHQQKTASTKSGEAYAQIVLELYAIQSLFQRIVQSKAGESLRLLDRTLAQFIFFTRHRERRAVSPFWFRILWPLVRAKEAVVLQLKARGIYCAYSHALAKQLANITRGRLCLEIGAGDGTLSLLLEQHGVQVIATDDKSWNHVVRYPEWVEKRDALASIKHYQPPVVICSWPPPNNKFESSIFASDCVETYIVIGSKHAFASGDRTAYRTADQFDLVSSASMESAIYPPETQPEVLIFQRKTNL